MELVLDANILIAALIKKGITADLIVDENIHLFAPEFIMDEFQKYRDEIVQKIHRTNIIAAWNNLEGIFHHF